MVGFWNLVWDSMGFSEVLNAGQKIWAKNINTPPEYEITLGYYEIMGGKEGGTGGLSRSCIVSEHFAKGCDQAVQGERFMSPIALCYVHLRYKIRKKKTVLTSSLTLVERFLFKHLLPR